MSDRETLVRAYQSGHLLEAVQAALSLDENERAKFTSDLVALHNEGLIDLVETFGCLAKNSASGPESYLLRHVFEELLPELEAPMSELIRCVLHLYREAGAGTIVDQFLEYCARQPERVQAALAEVKVDPERLADLVVPVLVAGSRIDSSTYIAETIRLSRAGNLELRRRALFALGRLQGEQVTWANESIAEALENAVAAEDDDQVLASAIRSSFSLAPQGKAGEIRRLAVLEAALLKGGDVARHAASMVFGFQAPESSSELLAVLLEHLALVDPSDRSTLTNIDHGVARRLQDEHIDAGLRFLENLLRARFPEIELSNFGEVVRAIRNSLTLRSKVVTRWLLSGEAAFCDGLAAIVDGPMGGSPEIEADPSELAGADEVRFVFAARKAIGYLFQKPISAASFILSLMRRAADAKVRSDLETLLLNPLLLNFSGSVKEYLAHRAEAEEEVVRESVRRSLEALEAYLDDSGSVGDIPALQPSLEHRQAYHRHLSEEVAQSFKKAQIGSILQLFHRSVLLYGRKAIHHAFGNEGEIRRMETHLGRQSAGFEVPRMTIVDPHGLDFMLRVFRHERMSA